jgi:enamine deaminase RidA (YjgF/YER057c/UK114 family)
MTTLRDGAEARLHELGLPVPAMDGAASGIHEFNLRRYGLPKWVVPHRRFGRLLFTASVPTLDGREYHLGVLGRTVTAEQGYEAARIAALSALLKLRGATGHLDRVSGIVRVFCFLIGTPEFPHLGRVASGVWDVFTHVLGRRGEHVLAPVGMPGIAGGHCVELVLVSEVSETDPGSQEEPVDNDSRFLALGAELPVTPTSAVYEDLDGIAGRGLPYRQSGELLIVHALPTIGGQPTVRGRVGAELNVEEGYQAARKAGINLLATVRTALGSLNRVEQVLQLTGFIATPPGFTEQPLVLNGATDVLVEVLGESGGHTRGAIGCMSLPGNAPVQLVAMLKIRNSL